jgi:prolyl oligopeptidase
MIGDHQMRRIPRGAFLAAPLLAFFSPTFAQAEPAAPMTALVYPQTQRGDVVEDHFGVAVADPYRWLETEAASDPAVADWVAAQNVVTDAYLATLPGRDVFRERLNALFSSDLVSTPLKRGGRYFYIRQAGLVNQPSLMMRESIDGPERVLIDPNAWSEDGTTALAEWAPSDDGAHVAYAVQDGGTDWRSITVLDVATGAVLPDKVDRARFTSIAWAKDGSGFFYARYADAKDGSSSQAGITGHSVYFHALGTTQSEDRLLYATPDHPQMLQSFTITHDGNYAVVTSTPGVATNSVTVVDLTQGDWRPLPVVDNFEDQWISIGNVGTRFYFMTNKDAERLKIVTLDIADADPVFVDLIPEQETVMTNAWLIGDLLLTSALDNAMTQISRFALDGTPDGTVTLPGIGSAGGFQGSPGDDEAFFVFTSFNVAISVYQYDVAANISRVWEEPEVAVDLDNITVDQQVFTSKDGTEVPMFIVKRADVTGPAPTMLYGYGGFGISILPSYSPTQLAWVDQGGVLAVANIRGGGEYGRAWHMAGRGLQKQNVFDDFIAAGEYLLTSGITSKDGLAIQGASNGGILVGAVVNQRPDLFAAALPGVGVMDMLRYNQFTGGQLWVEELGDPAVEESFRNLLSYSPYHNIRPGEDYPAILVTTADTDNRVVPGHSFKYVAALQAADIGPMPHLVRIETRAGHGAGKPIDMVIAETADMWAFAAYWTGLDVGALD